MFQKSKPTKEAQYHIEMMQRIKTNWLQLGHLYKQASRLPIQKDIKILCNATNQILIALCADRQLIYQLGMFAEYYLPETTMVLNQYFILPNDAALRTQIALFAPQAAQAFTQMANSIGQNDLDAGSLTQLLQQLQTKQGL